MRESFRGICEKCGKNPKVHWDIMWCIDCRSRGFDMGLFSHDEWIWEEHYYKQKIKELENKILALEEEIRILKGTVAQPEEARSSNLRK